MFNIHTFSYKYRRSEFILLIIKLVYVFFPASNSRFKSIKWLNMRQPKLMNIEVTFAIWHSPVFKPYVKCNESIRLESFSKTDERFVIVKEEEINTFVNKTKEASLRTTYIYRKLWRQVLCKGLLTTLPALICPGSENKTFSLEIHFLRTTSFCFFTYFLFF